MTIEAPVCIECTHFDRSDAAEIKCKAFPKRIPDVIWIGGDEHNKPLPDQKNNIVFKPIK